jgi:hypothetical protein
MRLLATLYLGLACASACLITHAIEKDIIIEFKGAYFQPMHHTFKHIYHGAAIFGPEITFNLFGPIYGFASYDFLPKNGKSIGLKTPTKVRMHVLAVGFKYISCVADNVSLYAGLGFEPISLHTKNDSPFVIPKTHKWGFGGIVKFGTYIDLPCNFVLDLFADYSFVDVKRTSRTIFPVGFIEQTKANLSGFVLGGGLGYRFN